MRRRARIAWIRIKRCGRESLHKRAHGDVRPPVWKRVSLAINFRGRGTGPYRWRRHGTVGEELLAGGPDFVFVVGGRVVHDFVEFGKFEEGLAGGVELPLFAI